MKRSLLTKDPKEFVDQWKILEIYVIQKKYIIYTYLSIYSPIIFLNFLFWDDMTLLKQKLCTDFFKQKIESITGVTASTLPLTIMEVENGSLQYQFPFI